MLAGGGRQADPPRDQHAEDVAMLLDPSDVCGVLYNAESLVRESFDIVDGCIRPPRGSGLGVTLDEGRLAALTRG